ncbi:MAG: trypsin-like serine protease [Planctomycetes bacterium]|nr:trypsin-like serine protease [Planctomycetota bacterium]
MKKAIEVLLLAVCCLASVCLFADDDDATLRIRKATVKIRTTYIRPVYFIPWRMMSNGTVTGSGAVITGNRVLTNAHVVSDATFIQVTKENDPNQYEAEVQFIGHECDLAILKVKDKKFFADTTQLEVGNTIPKLKSVVATYGYPVGGERISITEGVVSRVEIRSYSHSSKSAFLMVQTDAAINPGNSGGPVIQNDKIIGVAFQVRTGSENIGYMVPTPIIQHFIEDVADGRFDGFPDLGVFTSDLENGSYRNYLGMQEGQSGVVVDCVVPKSSAAGHLKDGDVIMSVDGVPIANDGSIPLEDGRIRFTHLVDLKHIGEAVELGIWREKKPMAVRFPVLLPPVRIPWFKQFESLPRYYIYAGLIFTPLSRGYLETWNKWYYNADPLMLYYYTCLQRDRCHPERQEFIVLVSVLPDPANTYVSDVRNKIVSKINGIAINRLEDVIEAFKRPLGKFHRVDVEGGRKPIVLNAEQAKKASAQILMKYRIPSDRRLDKHTGYGRK